MNPRLLLLGPALLLITSGVMHAQSTGPEGRNRFHSKDARLVQSLFEEIVIEICCLNLLELNPRTPDPGLSL